MQIVLAIILVATIMLQQNAAGTGGAFGSSDGNIINYTRRGFERTLFQCTIVFGILFVLSIFIQIFL
ncbi:preprotein translocase subunit SecG [Candidatus Nomurabacteria bacterium CG1_02_47_685]|nr:MAG: preprotein translocase subunit SecG [Candidatus Nomurabacteria bacterium CG1_02_47_685]